MSILDACGRYENLATRTEYSVVYRSYHRILDLQDLFANLNLYGGQFREVNQKHLVVTFMNETLNWLTSTRFYLEATRNFALINYGENSQQVRDHIEATHEAFDTFPGYQFMYKLRDYAQHGGIPLAGLNVLPQSNGDSRLVPYLSKDVLLNARFDWKRTVRNLIERSEDSIPLIPLIDEAMKGYEVVERNAYKLHLDRASETANTIIEAYERLNDNEGHAAIIATNMAESISSKTLPSLDSLAKVQQFSVLSKLPGRPPRQRPAEELSGLPREAAKRASAATAALLFPDHPDFENVVGRILEEDGSPVPLVSGLADLSRTLLTVSARALGTTREAMLGAITPTDP